MQILVKSTVRGNWLRTALTLVGMLVLFCAYSQNPFITTWKTDNPGTSNSTSITIPTNAFSTYNYDVDWDNDGTYDQTGITGNVTHDFGTAGTYTIRIKGSFPRIFFFNTGDREKILDIVQWGSIAWTSMDNAFNGCSNLTCTATDAPNLAGVLSCYAMFKGCTVFNGAIGTWNTAAVTNMNEMFANATAFNQPIGTWNTAAVTNMAGMFNGATAFNQPIGTWNTAAVTNMGGMFYIATAFNQPIGTWNTAAVTNMAGMFGSAAAFNQPIGTWNTAAVINMSNMFNGATAFNQPIGAWNTAAVTYMNVMFENTSAFNQPIGTWNTAAVTNMSVMFKNAAAFNQPIGNWNTTAVTNMGSMFANTTAFNQPIGNWNTENVTNMSFMFENATAFNQSLGNWTLNPAVDMGAMLTTCGMDCANYSTTLNGWNANPLTPDALSLGANGRTYETAVVTAHTNLTATKGWTINGDALISTIFYADADGDGFGNPAVSQNACTAPSGYVTNSMDCNDGNASVFPGGTEICDGLDNDCNGTIDDVAACGSAGTRTWTGLVSTDWHTPCNWNPGCVPTADDDVVIANVANDPTISAAAVAKSVWVNSGGVLTIAAMGTLAIESGTISYAMRNQGTVHNHGTITIGAVSTVGFNGIRNEGAFTNHPGGQIQVDRSTDSGIANFISGTFTNAAIITIGGIASPGSSGIVNSGIFNNNSGAQIQINRSTAAGLFNGGTFNNDGSLTLGANFSVGFQGIFSNGTINNNPDGHIQIDRTFTSGIHNNTGGSFQNKGDLHIGAIAAGAYGLLNNAAFSNHSSGQILIERANSVGLLNEGSGAALDNYGTLTIAANNKGGIQNSLSATMHNRPCAQMFLYGRQLSNDATWTNSGFFRVDFAASAHTNTSTFTNDGIIEYPQGNPVPNVVNNEITVALTTANTCDVISPAVGLGSPLDFTIVGIFTDAAATMSAGTYTVATNTFTPTSVLAEGAYTYYVKIEDSNGGCTRIATWKLITENCCDAPEAICKSATIVLVGNSASLSASDVNNGSTYECGLQSMTVSSNSFGCSHVGSPQTVTLTVTDVKGDSDHCTATVMVLDNTVPSITCPAPMTVPNTTGQCGAYVTYAPTVSDNCSGATFTVRSGPVSGSLFPVGTTAVQLQAADATGLTATCDFTIRVHDTELPSIACPNNIIRSTAANACGAVVAYMNPTYSDNCPGAGLDHLSGGTSGSTFPVGTTNVVWMATDAANNTRSCSFSITVTDTQVPTITCPANMVRPTTTGQCAAQVTFNNPTASDNCAAPTLQWVSGGTSTAQGPTTSAGTFAKGTTTVQWKATDATGLTKTCTFRVIVNDTEAPTMSCPAALNANASPGQCGAAVTYSNPTYTDNCAPTSGTAVRVSGPPSGSTFSAGTTNVVFRATDAAGNTRQCTLTVTIVDNQPPTISCPPSLTVTGNGIPCTATVVYAPPTASDNCMGLSNPYLVSGLASGSVFPVGVTTNTWQVIDPSGVTAQCAFTVTVNCPTVQPPSGAEDRAGATSDLSLAPNPAATEVAVSIQGEKEVSGTLSVYDATGRLVWQQNSAVMATVRLDVSTWPSGVYAVSWRQGKTVMVKRLVVAWE